MPLNPSSMLVQLLIAPMRPGHVVWLGVRPGGASRCTHVKAPTSTLRRASLAIAIPALREADR